MNFSDYLHSGQVVDLELEIRSKSPKYTVRVEEILDNTLAVALLDAEPSSGDWQTGTKGIIWSSKNISIRIMVKPTGLNHWLRTIMSFSSLLDVVFFNFPVKCAFRNTQLSCGVFPFASVLF